MLWVIFEVGIVFRKKVKKLFSEQKEIKSLSAYFDKLDLFSERIAVVDHDGERNTTYRQFYENSKKVNAYLRKKGIGSEDSVAIHVPRGMEYMAIRVGVIMAGAAWVSLEDMMGVERIAFVKKDCNCKLEFTMQYWEEAMKEVPCAEIKTAKPHDLAFYIYTSGSTGKPKGLAQEYGIYKNLIEGCCGFMEPYSNPPSRFAHVIPESYVGGVYITMGELFVGNTVHVLSFNFLRDIKDLARYFAINGIDTTFMTPHFLRAMLKMPGFTLRAGFTGGEIVSDIYSPEFDIVNIYGSSEFGYTSCLFTLDKSYRNTPIGYATCNSDIVLIDEDGNEADEGVFCIALPFFRRYNKDSEKDQFILHNGKNYFKTSDYAKKDSDGKYTILGRIDNMVKINGNRVDPSEIESAAKSALSLEFCVVKAFAKNGLVRLGLYYKDEKEIDVAEAAKKLESYLPIFMIPSFFVKLDEIPFNANGKVDKLALKEPDNPEDLCYVVPENELQKKICDLFEKVLDVDRKIGIDDDFFFLGGDSIRAMELVSESRDVVESFSFKFVYGGRTPRKIAELVQRQKAENHFQKVPAFLSGVLERKGVPVNEMQLNFLNLDFKHPGTTMLNLAYKFKLSDEIGLDKFSAALSKEIAARPVLSSVIEKRGPEFYIRKPADNSHEIPVEEMNARELKIAEEEISRPFNLDGSPLFRCRLVRSKNEKFLLLCVYHTVCDGLSLQHFLKDLSRVYHGDEPSKDYFYPLLQKDYELRNSMTFEEDREFFISRYRKENYDAIPRVDFDLKENVDGQIAKPFPFSKNEVKEFCEKIKIGENAFYCAAFALSVCQYNNSKLVRFGWVWNGRNDVESMNSVGVLIREIPIAFSMEKEKSPRVYLENAQKQIEEGINHASLSYCLDEWFMRKNGAATVIFQNDVYDYRVIDGIISGVEGIFSDKYPTACESPLDLEIIESPETFEALFDYNGALYKPESMEKFAEIFVQNCEKLLKEM
ncbi:AMP-dependent synthetase and ligase [Fibrobacter succinogenes subsp. succinogenes S85]|uniref:AMP-dependent synthetase and ligase n=1 Tax=Fibrobacter succinogenes (strain ATCC 19169 / S85) TaxID=59374 RepID=A0ABN3YZA6_FIBSS|nr:AMP-binding protein [Fibrobacter succinogenes]ACX76020.1 AMP-dependent synthetase and ligase [Fibrobacter succinogenes subsp. succinogenes S85]